ncbi:hypothetical protein UFOVP92_49 [uncultured Caudovirales phage]|uniref:Uncharacterized protein n=1 Tax=uncultured Caudovirales phage TaxID=2100421 RepID=A0A6J5KYN1_9CAUD|nr:hypothetical protein UFOVP92_49 [uncultured Caudovirales phage]
MTDTITLPRAEAQQILDALYDDDDGMEASKILRAALAQQANPVIGKAITEVEPNENQIPIAWINWNAATGERSVSFEQESELASQPLYYTPVTGYDLDEITDLKEERERQRDHAVGEIQKLIARNAELESHMRGLSNEINDFQNTIERLTKKVAERSAEHLAAHITHDKGYQEGMIDSQNGFEKYLKEGETPLQRLEREIKDGSALMKIYGKALTQIQELQAQRWTTPIAFYEIANNEYGEIEYEFSVYPRPGFKPLFSQAIPAAPKGGV